MKVLILDDKEAKRYNAFKRHNWWHTLVVALIMGGIAGMISVYGAMIHLQATASGWYIPWFHATYIEPQNDIEFMSQVAFHEIGHHVYYTKLSSKERNEWITLYNASDNRSFVSNYAKTNPSEDFAETYVASWYCRYQPTNKTIASKAKLSFMRNISDDVFAK